MPKGQSTRTLKHTRFAPIAVSVAFAVPVLVAIPPVPVSVALAVPIAIRVTLSLPVSLAILPLVCIVLDLRIDVHRESAAERRAEGIGATWWNGRSLGANILGGQEAGFQIVSVQIGKCRWRVGHQLVAISRLSCASRSLLCDALTTLLTATRPLRTTTP